MSELLVPSCRIIIIYHGRQYCSRETILLIFPFLHG